MIELPSRQIPQTEAQRSRKNDDSGKNHFFFVEIEVIAEGVEHEEVIKFIRFIRFIKCFKTL